MARAGASLRRSIPTLRGMSFALVGPGRVGWSLASWLVARGAHWVRVGLHRADPAAVERFRRRFSRLSPGARALEVVEAGDLVSHDVDLLLIATPDPTLRPLARHLGRRPQAGVALHAAGALGAETLDPLRRGGSAVGTLHPLHAFARPVRRPPRELVFAVGGDPRAIALAERIAGACGAEAARVDDRQRLAYHLGATLAAGGAVTLLAEAAALAREAGLPDSVLRGYRRLLLGAAANADPLAPAAAITGPVARGDAAWLRRQARALARQPRRLRLVLAVARATRAAGASRGDDEFDAELDRLARALRPDGAIP